MQASATLQFSSANGELGGCSAVTDLKNTPHSQNGSKQTAFHHNAIIDINNHV
jgi:hypothetical protein